MSDQNRPNIIFILADDMGYGDMRCNNPDSQIPTPHLDSIAQAGMRFTDVHSTSAVCTPSRYGVLTGRYNWRSRLKQGIVWEWDGALIEPDQPTVANYLKSQGYDTACIGKWHLGWEWSTLDGRHPNETVPYGVVGEYAEHRRRIGDTNIDYTGRIGGGPVDRGFDSYFGVDVPNFPPYAWFEDDHLTEQPTSQKPESMYGRPGPMVPGWSLEAMIPEFTKRAVSYIEEHGLGGRSQGAPFYLHFPLTSPHSPIVPNEPFKGMSGIGGYGDFVCEVDWVVGQIRDALERSGQFENTLLIFTSDNGPELAVGDDEGAFNRAQRTGHFSMDGLRGIKRDAWEGGHRVPFVCSWPDAIPAGSVCDQVAGLVDFMATCSDIVGAPLPDRAGPDSVSMLPLMRGRTDQPTRDHLIYHSMKGNFAIRQGDWVFIDAPCGGTHDEPEWFRELRGYESHDQPGELFNLKDDLIQRVNQYAQQPELVAELKAKLEQVKGQDAERGDAGAETAPGPMTE